MESVNRKDNIMWLSVAFVSLQVVDSVLTTLSVQNGIAQEENPTAIAMVKTWWNIPMKVIPAVLACWLTVWIVNRFPRLQRALTIGLTCIVVLMALVAINNLAQIVLHYTVRG